jgi:hypothetical protein
MLNLSVSKKISLVLAGVFVSGLANAADGEASSAPSYLVGGLKAYPGLGLVLKQDSNIFRAKTNEKSSFITVLSPSILLQTQQDANSFSLGYSVDVGRFGNSSDDNFVDQKVLGQAVLGLSSRSTLKMMPEYTVGHDDRGSTFGAATTVPNTWSSSGLNGAFAYGSEDSTGKLLLDLGFSDRSYQNNRTVTTAYDRSLNNVGGTFYLNVFPKTSALLSVKYTGIAYKLATSTLNSTEQRILVGAKWEATEQTSGEIKVGQLQKKFDSTFATQSVASWEGVVRWSPVTYLNVDFSSSKQPSETTLTGTSAVMVSNSGVNVVYSLTDRVSLTGNVNQVKEEFVGGTAPIRSDSTNNFLIKSEYKFRNWLVGGIEFSNSNKTSSNTANDYKRNIFMLSVRSVI